MKHITNWDDVPLLISVSELAQILRVSRNTAYELVRSGQIPSARASTQIRISKDSLKKYLDVA